MNKLFFTFLSILVFYHLNTMLDNTLLKNNSLDFYDIFDNQTPKDTIKPNMISKDIILFAQPLRDHDFPTIADTIGKFYIDDIQIIEVLLQDWLSTNPKKVSYSEKYRFTYNISLINKGVVNESFFINIPSEFIYKDDTYFEFNNSLFIKYRKSYKPVKEKDSTFSSLPEAREYLNQLKKDDKLISYSAIWEKYDGEFTYNLPLFDNSRTSEELISQLEKELKKSYPNEQFNINHHTQFSDMHTFRIQGNESLFIQLKENAKQWQPFVSKLYIFLKSN